MPRPINAVRDAQIEAAYLAGATTSQVGVQFGLSKDGVRKALIRRSVPRRPAGRRLPLRHDAFDVLTPASAYWCGFLFADGSVIPRLAKSPLVSVGLSACDRGHLEALRAFLGSAHAITDTAAYSYGGYVSGPGCLLRVSSSRLAARLLDLGRYEGPIAVELAASAHFWRGVVDGDGYLCPGRPRFGLVGTRRLLEAFNAFLVACGEPPRSIGPHKSIHAVHASHGPARRIIAHLYADAPIALARKSVRAKTILAAG